MQKNHTVWYVLHNSDADQPFPWLTDVVFLFRNIIISSAVFIICGFIIIGNTLYYWAAQAYMKSDIWQISITVTFTVVLEIYHIGEINSL